MNELVVFFAVVHADNDCRPVLDLPGELGLKVKVTGVVGTLLGLVDRLPDGRRVIYLPGAPDPRAGSVMVMDADRVEPVQTTFVRATAALRALGRGLGPTLSQPSR